jgi:transposase
MSSLALIVEREFKLDLFDNATFVFVSRDRRAIKCLYWDRCGFALWYKRLESERFIMPTVKNETVELPIDQIHMLLDGYDIWAMQRSHKTIKLRRFS